MRWEKIKKRAFAMAVCCVALLSCALCVSCSDDAYNEEALSETDGSTFSVQLRVVVKNLADSNGYEDGIGYENYIRLTGVDKGTWTDVDYRILFYNSNDVWIGSLGSLNIVEKVGSDYTVYDILGETSYISSSNSGEVKVVMIANWMDYSYLSSVRQDLNNLSRLCDPASLVSYPNAGTYEALVDEEGQALLPSPENGLIPFYGICADNVTFEAGKRTTLSEDISLLRAMAKVEVVLENEDLTFTDVTLHGYNERGYCAPYNVTSQKDYVHGNWDDDYVANLHTRSYGNRGNLTNAKDNTMRFVKTQEFGNTQEGTETQYETWVAYVPEYDNTNDVDDYSYITVTINGSSFNIYFADYTDGVTDNTNVDNRFDIHRNNLYRFYVRFNQREDNITVTVTKWNEKSGSFIVLPNGNGNAQYV